MEKVEFSELYKVSGGKKEKLIFVLRCTDPNCWRFTNPIIYDRDPGLTKCPTCRKPADIRVTIGEDNGRINKKDSFSLI